MKVKNTEEFSWNRSINIPDESTEMADYDICNENIIGNKTIGSKETMLNVQIDSSLQSSSQEGSIDGGRSHPTAIHFEVLGEYLRHELFSLKPLPNIVSCQEAYFRLSPLIDSLNYDPFGSQVKSQIPHFKLHNNSHFQSQINSQFMSPSQFMDLGSSCLDKISDSSKEEFLMGKQYMILYFQSICLERFPVIDSMVSKEDTGKFSISQRNRYRKERKKIVLQVDFSNNPEISSKISDLLRFLAGHISQYNFPTSSNTVHFLSRLSAEVKSGKLKSHREVLNCIQLHTSNLTGKSSAVSKQLDESIDATYTMKALEHEISRCFSYKNDVGTERDLSTELLSFQHNNDYNDTLLRALAVALDSITNVKTPNRSRLDEIVPESEDLEKKSLEYCALCQKRSSELAYCVDCPRAYHLQCLLNAGILMPGRTSRYKETCSKWKCCLCRLESKFCLSNKNLQAKLLSLQCFLERHDLISKFFTIPVDLIQYPSYTDYVTSFETVTSCGRTLYKFLIRPPVCEENSEVMVRYIQNVAVLYIKMLLRIICNCQKFYSNKSTIQRASQVFKRILSQVYYECIRMDLREENLKFLEKEFASPIAEESDTDEQHIEIANGFKSLRFAHYIKINGYNKI